MTRLFVRRLFVLLSLVSLGVLAGAFNLEYRQGLMPCPLCLMQRAVAMGIFFLAFLGIWVARMERARWVLILLAALAVAGAYFAGRQMWLQSFTTEHASACMPGLDVLMRYFPWKDILHALFWGTADCAEKAWSFGGLSLPAWSFTYFCVVFLISLSLHWRLR